MNEYQKGIYVMNLLQKLGLDMITIGAFIDNKNLNKSCQLLQENPKISQKELLARVKTE